MFLFWFMFLCTIWYVTGGCVTDSSSDSRQRRGGRLTIYLDNALAGALRRKAAQLDVSLSALAAGYIDQGLHEGERAAVIDRMAYGVEHLEKVAGRLDGLLARLEDTVDRTEAAGGMEADEQRAFYLEALLYLRELFKDKLSVQADIAARVRQVYGDKRPRGL
jgi:hypothetical protein